MCRWCFCSKKIYELETGKLNVILTKPTVQLRLSIGLTNSRVIHGHQNCRVVCIPIHRSVSCQLHGESYSILHRVITTSLNSIVAVCMNWRCSIKHYDNCTLLVIPLLCRYRRVQKQERWMCVRLHQQRRQF